MQNEPERPIEQRRGIVHTEGYYDYHYERLALSEYRTNQGIHKGRG